MVKLFSKLCMNVGLMGLCILLVPLGFSVTASAQQNNNINGPTRVERANLRQEFNSDPILSSSISLPYLLGVEKFNAKDYTAAEKAFRKVLTHKPRHAKTNYYMGAISALRGKDKQAIRYYKKSLKSYKSNPIIMANLGVSYAKIDKQKKAKSILSTLKSNSNNCNNNCANSEMIADAIHVLSEALYNS